MVSAEKPTTPMLVLVRKYLPCPFENAEICGVCGGGRVEAEARSKMSRVAGWIVWESEDSGPGDLVKGSYDLASIMIATFQFFLHVFSSLVLRQCTALRPSSGSHKTGIF